MANYTNQALIEAFLQRSLNASEATLLTTALPAVKIWIDSYLESQFDNVAASTRYFESRTKTLDIDPCQTITAITSLDPYQVAYYSYQTFEFVAEPINDTIKREIRLRYGNFPEGTSNIAVAAIFTEYDYVNNCVPYDIEIAATRIMAGIINAGKYAKIGGNVHRENLEGHFIQYDITPNAIAVLTKADPILCALLDSRKEVMYW